MSMLGLAVQVQNWQGEPLEGALCYVSINETAVSLFVEQGQTYVQKPFFITNVRGLAQARAYYGALAASGERSLNVSMTIRHWKIRSPKGAKNDLVVSFPAAIHERQLGESKVGSALLPIKEYDNEIPGVQLKAWAWDAGNGTTGEATLAGATA